MSNCLDWNTDYQFLAVRVQGIFIKPVPWFPYMIKRIFILISIGCHKTKCMLVCVCEKCLEHLITNIIINEKSIHCQ